MAPEFDQRMIGSIIVGEPNPNGQPGLVEPQEELPDSARHKLRTKWEASPTSESVFEGRDRDTDELQCKGSRVDLIFGSNADLRAIGEVYTAIDAKEKFVRDFVDAWSKVMKLDRFDLK